MVDVGKKIRNRRKQLGMSQDDLAHKLGYKGRTSINKIELGGSDLPIDKLPEIAKALGVSINYLLTEDEDFITRLAERYKGMTFSEDEQSRIIQFIDFVLSSRS